MSLPEEPMEPLEAADPQEGRTGFPCTYCGAPTHADIVKAAFWGHEGLVAIEDIPARVCEGCGEQFYDDPIAQRIEEIIAASTAPPKRQIVVPVFSLADAAPEGPPQQA
jgi:YgiT-type zinc finger domain-containing protein